MSQSTVVHINRASFEAKVPVVIDLANPHNEIKIDRLMARELKTTRAKHNIDSVKYPNTIPPQGYIIKVEILNLDKIGGSFQCNMTNSEKIPTFIDQVSKGHRSMIELDGKHFLKINLADINLSEDDFPSAETTGSDFNPSTEIKRKRKAEEVDESDTRDTVETESAASSKQ